MNQPDSLSRTQTSTALDKETPKVLSLLALASGALAMPQNSNADIIFTDLSSAPPIVGPTSSPLFLITTLPGTAQILFRALTANSPGGFTSRWIVAGQNAGYVRVKTVGSFVVPAQKSQAWNQIAGNSWQTGTVGSANYFGHKPNGFSNRYMAFRFRDSTAGNALRYGWVEMNLFNNFLSDDAPQVTILGYAYDTTGAQLPMGAVPEPTSAGLLALGALVLGAKGLRSWRRNRAESAGKP
jgi:hypothetical protein